MNHAIEYCMVHHNTNDNFHKESVIQLCVGTHSIHNKLFYTLYFAFNTWIADGWVGSQFGNLWMTNRKCDQKSPNRKETERLFISNACTKCTLDFEFWIQNIYVPYCICRNVEPKVKWNANFIIILHYFGKLNLRHTATLVLCVCLLSSAPLLFIIVLRWQNETNGTWIITMQWRNQTGKIKFAKTFRNSCTENHFKLKMCHFFNGQKCRDNSINFKWHPMNSEHLICFVTSRFLHFQTNDVIPCKIINNSTTIPFATTITDLKMKWIETSVEWKCLSWINDWICWNQRNPNLFFLIHHSSLVVAGCRRINPNSLNKHKLNSALNTSNEELKRRKMLQKQKCKNERRSKKSRIRKRNHPWYHHR